MKVTAAAVSLLAVGAGASSTKDPAAAFAAWQREYGETFAGGATEYKHRLAVFTENMKTVAALNNEGHATFALNRFAALSPEEFAAGYLSEAMGRAPAHAADKFLPPRAANATAASAFDWRESDPSPVTEVKDQGALGSCWAFSTAGNLEGQLVLSGGGALTSLSVEQILECDASFDDDLGHADCGEFGGWPYLALQYVAGAGGLRSDERSVGATAKPASAHSPPLQCTTAVLSLHPRGRGVAPRSTLNEGSSAAHTKRRFTPVALHIRLERTRQYRLVRSAFDVCLGSLSVDRKRLVWFIACCLPPTPPPRQHAVLRRRAVRQGRKLLAVHAERLLDRALRQLRRRLHAAVLRVGHDARPGLGWLVRHIHGSRRKARPALWSHPSSPWRRQRNVVAVREGEWTALRAVCYLSNPGRRWPPNRCLRSRAAEGRCSDTKVGPFAVSPNGWAAVSSDEGAIADELVATGPLSVALNAQRLQFYKSGVFAPSTCNPDELDHAVLLVGFGDDDADYWTVKNSWGDSCECRGGVVVFVRWPKRREGPPPLDHSAVRLFCGWQGAKPATSASCAARERAASTPPSSRAPSEDGARAPRQQRGGSGTRPKKRGAHSERRFAVTGYS